MRSLCVFFILLTGCTYAQSEGYFPFIDTVVIFEGEQDSLKYDYEKTSKGVTITATKFGSANVIFFSDVRLEQSKYFVNYEHGAKDVIFSSEPEKGEEYLSQSRKSRVVSLKGKLDFRNSSYKDLLVVETWFGDDLYPCTYYFAEKIGLIAFGCEGESMYYRIFD